MTHEEFTSFTKKTLTKIENLLCSKGAEYSPTDNRFENFIRGAKYLGQTNEQCLLGYLTKHLVSIADIVQNDTGWDKLPEKTHDIIAYMILLEAMVSERAKQGDSK